MTGISTWRKNYMNKKLLLISLLVVFTLVAISLTSVIGSNTVKPVEKKDSPLFGIRTRRATGDRLENIKTRFIGERVFFLPLTWLRNRDDRSVRQQLQYKTPDTEYDITCTHEGCGVTVVTPILCTIYKQTICGPTNNCDTCDPYC